MTRTSTAAIAMFGWLFCSSALGCALTSKSEPWTMRYFTPTSSGGESASDPEAASGSALQLRLGRISAGAHLRQAIAYRGAGGELGYYEDLRWTENPDVYLRRALARALFETRGVKRVVSGAAPTLDVELTAFEELRSKPPKVRVQAIVLLHDQRVARAERTVTVERANRSTDDAAAGTTAALGEALEEAVDKIVALTIASLQTAAQ